jgi:hypothetical protein
MAAMDVSRSGSAALSLQAKITAMQQAKPAAAAVIFQWANAHQGAACATLWAGASSLDKKSFQGESRHGRIFTP